MKPNSKVPETLEVFAALTSFASNTWPLWRPNKDHFALTNDDSLSEFVYKIDKRNGIPSLHTLVTSVKQPCGCHNDASLNSKNHADVVCISIIEGEEQISCNAQQIKSIGDYKLHCPDFGEPLCNTHCLKLVKNLYGQKQAG
jgi:hypothetical protein